MKSLSILVVTLLLISSFAAIGISKKAEVETNSFEQETTIEKTFLKPTIEGKTIENTLYANINLEGANSFTYLPGKPILPAYNKKLNLPFGATIKDIDCIPKNIQTKTIENKIIPAPNAVITNIENNKAEYEMDEEIYNSNNYYPEKWYTISTGAGLDENSEHKTFVNIKFNPVKYSPNQNKIQYAEDIEVNIKYQTSEETPFPETANYDMVIISPSEFKGELQRFVAHKNKYEIETYLKTTEEIYNEYDGFDKPEQIKYFIKDAIETEGIKYVLLVGGMTSLISGKSRDDENQGSQDWYLPVRYTNLRESGGVYDPGFISDLYYADIYDSEGNFSSWDEDKYGESDGVYAKWSMFGSRDIIDFYPDVMVGRLACRNLNEVKNVVTKIIDYERLKHETNWFDDMVLIGGDSHDDAEDYVEGEVACSHIADTYMEEFNPIKLYASNGKTSPNIPSPEAIKREITAGCGHLLFEGHGHPGSWNTHWPGEFNWEDTPGGIDILDFPSLKNDVKLPVCVIGGCHNGQFNVTLTATSLDKPFMWTHGMPVPECFAWHLVKMKGGGTIASFGNTGLGYGAVGENGDLDGDGENLPDTLEAFGGLQIRLFYDTLDEGKEMLGEAWLGAQTKYLDARPGMDYNIDAKTVEQWPMLGDPSLKIGGYQTDDKAKNIPDLFERFPVLEKLLEMPIFQRILEKIN